MTESSPLVQADNTELVLNLDDLTVGNGELNVGTDHQIVINATENRSTAYEWEIVTDTCESSIKTVFDDYEAGPQFNDLQDLIGAAGKRTWIFQTPTKEMVGDSLHGKNCFIKFVNHRPWEPPSP